MNKIKNTSKLIIGFILGAVIFGGLTGMLAYAINASDVSFAPSDNSWEVENVKTALDDLYEKANNTIETYKSLECPGCVFRLSNEMKCKIETQDSNSDMYNPNCKEEMLTLTEGEYTSDYHSLNSNYFIGHIINLDGYILENYVCGIENEKLFCLNEGHIRDDLHETNYHPLYMEKLNKLKNIFPNCNPRLTSSATTCYGSTINMTVYVHGAKYVTNKEQTNYCRIEYGSSKCGTVGID